MERAALSATCRSTPKRSLPGSLFEDIREAVFKLADPSLYDAVVIINLCVPTASGVPLQLLPKDINGVRIIGIDVPGFGVPTHAEAKDVLAGAMLAYARREAERGPVQAPREKRSDKPSVTLIGEIFPADPVGIGMLLDPLGLAAGPVVPTREWRELYAALDCADGRRASTLLYGLHPRIRGSGTHRSSVRRRSGKTAPRLGSRRSARRAALRGRKSQRRKINFFPRLARRWRNPRSKAASRCPATRVRNCWSRGFDRKRRRRSLCRHRVPAHALVGGGSRMARSQGRAACNIAHPWNRTSRPWRSSSPISPSERPRSCKKRRQWRSRRSTSPI